jgi:hypothetical protein
MWYIVATQYTMPGRNAQDMAMSLCSEVTVALPDAETSSTLTDISVEPESSASEVVAPAVLAWEPFVVVSTLSVELDSTYEPLGPSSTSSKAFQSPRMLSTFCSPALVSVVTC